MKYWPIENVDFRDTKQENAKIVELFNTENLPFEFAEYASKFISAGNVLGNHVVAIKSHGIRDTWLFPIVYLYRQSLELLIKAIAFKYIVGKEERLEFLSRVNHNLADAFEEVRINIVSENLTSIDEVQWLSLYLNDISTRDRESDMFRYPFSTNMKKFFDKQLHVNLRMLCENMNVAYTILNNIFLHRSTPVDIAMREPVLLPTGGAYYDTSIIGWQFQNNNDFYPYVNGYMESANHLFVALQENKNHLFLPMCYLYRNGIELALKRILIEGCNLQANKHGVISIWNKIRDEIQSIANTTNEDTTLLNVDKYIDKLSQLDSCSSTFRYPTNRHLGVHFKKKKKLDANNVSDRFNELFNFLDSVDTMISVKKEAEAEMYSQYYDYDY
jgi:hypothetical protein